MADKQKTGLQAFKIDTRSRTAFITVWMQPHNSLCVCGVWGGGVSAYGNICLYAGGCLYVCCFFMHKGAPFVCSEGSWRCSSVSHLSVLFVLILLVSVSFLSQIFKYVLVMFSLLYFSPLFLTHTFSLLCCI